MIHRAGRARQPHPDPGTTGQVAKAPRGRAVVLTCGTFGNVLRFLPPLVIGEGLLEEGLSILEDAFAALEIRRGAAGARAVSS